MQDWLQLLSFLQAEIDQAGTKGYPTTLVDMIRVLLRLARACYRLVKYLQDPTNQYHKICPQCGKEFSHPSRWVKTCTSECHEKWLTDPCGYMSDDGNMTGSTLLLMQQMDLQEESQP